MFLITDRDTDSPHRVASPSPRPAPLRRLVGEVCDEAGLRALAQPWRDLHADTAFPSPFHCWEWAWAWWQHFGPGRRLRVLTVCDRNGLLLAIAPFYCAGADSPLLSREWRLLGDDGRDGEGMTDEPTLLLRQGREEEAMQALLGYLWEGRGRSDWDFLKLRLATPKPALGASCPPASDSFFRRARRQEGAQVVALPDSWAAFRSTLSRSMRDNLAYYPRRLARHGFSLQIDLVREPDAVRRAAGVLADLHNRRAHSARGPCHLSHIPTDKHTAFLQECLPTLAAVGMASVALLRVDGEIVAAQAYLEAGDNACGGRELVLYYSGYCPAWYEYSPVMLLGAAAIEDAIRRGVARLNFLPGPMSWKERWGTQSRGAIDDIRFLRPHARSLTRVLLRSLHRRLSAPRQTEQPALPTNTVTEWSPMVT